MPHRVRPFLLGGGTLRCGALVGPRILDRTSDDPPFVSEDIDWVGLGGDGRIATGDGHLLRGDVRTPLARHPSDGIWLGGDGLGCGGESRLLAHGILVSSGEKPRRHWQAQRVDGARIGISKNTHSCPIMQRVVKNNQ